MENVIASAHLLAQIRSKILILILLKARSASLSEKCDGQMKTKKELKKLFILVIIFVFIKKTEYYHRSISTY